MDIVHGLILLMATASLVATLVLLKQRIVPLAEPAAEDLAAVLSRLSSPGSSPEAAVEQKKMRVAVMSDERAARKEREEAEKTPNPGLEH